MEFCDLLLTWHYVSKVRLLWHIIEVHPFSLLCNSPSLSCWVVFSFSYYESMWTYPKNRLAYPKAFMIMANTLSTSGWKHGLQWCMPPPNAPCTPQFLPTLGVVGLLTANGLAGIKQHLTVVLQVFPWLPRKQSISRWSCAFSSVKYQFTPFAHFSIVFSPLSYRFVEVCRVLWTLILCGLLTLQIHSPSEWLDFHFLHGIILRKPSF